MSEKPTFCPRCRKMHAGVCAERPSPYAPTKPELEAARDLVAQVNPKFDKRAYQRDYMRKRRAKAD